MIDQLIRNSLNLSKQKSLIDTVFYFDMSNTIIMFKQAGSCGLYEEKNNCTGRIWERGAFIIVLIYCIYSFFKS